MPYKVLLVDDHQLVRTGIRRLLSDAKGITVVGEAESGEKALTLAREYGPNVVLMDANMPGMGGLEATRRLTEADPNLKVIIVTVHDGDPFPTLFLKAGASGYLTKGCSVDEIVTAIDTVCTGGRYLSSGIAQQLSHTLAPGQEQSVLQRLSDREFQVMLLVIEGKKIQEISAELAISPKTVSTYRYRLFDKLGVDSDVELTHLAMRHGVIASIT